VLAELPTAECMKTIVPLSRLVMTH